MRPERRPARATQWRATAAPRTVGFSPVSATPDPQTPGPSRWPERSSTKEPRAAPPLLLPKSSRPQPPEWEVLDDSGAVVGTLQEQRLATADRPFFGLIAIHPQTREQIPLELSADRDERLATLAAFLENPDDYSRHYPSASRARRALEAELGGPPWRMGTGRAGRHG